MAIIITVNRTRRNLHPATPALKQHQLESLVLHPSIILTGDANDKTAMPFQSDNAWPVGLIAIFNHARAKRTGFENRYYGPYDKLLNYCFGESFTFYVAPQNPPGDDRYDVVDVVVFLVVFDSNNKPVIIVEVKDDGWVEKAELRYRADEQMRNRFALMLDKCHLPRLWGLSLLGTSARVYYGDTTSLHIHPPAMKHPHESRVLPTTFLAGEWAIDILTKEGFAKMKEIVTDIMSHVPHN